MASDPPKLEEHPLNATLSRTSDKKMIEARESVQAAVKIDVASRPRGRTEDDDGEAMAALNLTNLADMMVLLVDKWRRAYWMTIACVVLILACVAMLVKAGFELDYLQRSQMALQEELRKTKDAVDKNTDEVKETRDVIKETKDKVTEAAENAPKVEVDDEGKARVVIRVSATPDSSAAPPPPKSTGMGGGGGALVPSGKKPPPGKPPPPAPAQTSVPLDPRLGLDF